MASVFLGDLDDFIQPSESCINPMFTNDSSSKPTNADVSKPEEASGGGITLSLELDDAMDVEPDLIRTNAETKTATVSLNDCLACSGCVTSAETVLIAQQSFAEVLQRLSEKSSHGLRVISIAPQVFASLAVEFKLSSMQVYRKLITLFHNLGFDLVIDTTSSADFSLLEARSEFVQRYRSRRKDHVWTSPPISFAESSARTVYPLGKENTELNPYELLPMLTSACPGWVCYAEKSQPNALPYISTTKSPQQMCGIIVKNLVCGKRRNLNPKQVYHVAVMPCYDKKLEASRKDFYDEINDSQEVDTVLTSTEILKYLSEQSIDFVALNETFPNAEEISLSGVSPDGQHFVGATSTGHIGSGGYLEHIFRFAAKEIYNVVVEGELQYTQGRNSDFREVKLVKDGKTVLCFAQAYGFRNIQGVLMKIKRKKCLYDFVEIMACPSGCLNGGGQIKRDDDQSVKTLDDVYRDRRLRNPEDNPVCRELYSAVLSDAPFSENARKLLHTRYHAVPKLELSNPLGIKW